MVNREARPVPRVANPARDRGWVRRSMQPLVSAQLLSPADADEVARTLSDIAEAWERGEITEDQARELIRLGAQAFAQKAPLVCATGSG